MVKSGGISNRNEKIGEDSIKNKKKMRRNMQRLGGKGGLSLESFANAKTRSDNYNPALIKKKKEFYKNAKYVQKYKRSLKHQEQQSVPSMAERQQLQDENQTSNGNNAKHQTNVAGRVNNKSKKNTQSLDEIYQKRQEEEEKARMEREAMIQAMKEAKQQSEARRKSQKVKMFKKTRSGQPVMKYRIEHILETIQGSSSK